MAVKAAGVHHQNGNIIEVGLQGFQKGMNTDEGVGFTDPGDQHEITPLMRFILHLLGKGVVHRNTLQLIQHKLGPLLGLLACDPVGNPPVIADCKEQLVKVVFPDVAFQALIRREILHEITHGHLFMGIIAENANIDVVVQATPGQEIRVLN